MPEPHTVVTSPREVHFHELTTPADPLLLPWLDLYETAFPPDERVLVSHVIRMLQTHEDPANRDRHLFAAVDDHGCLLGIVFDYEPAEIPAAYLWYIAVDSAARGQGIGAQVYQQVLARLRPGVRAMIFDLEDPRECADGAHRATAERRIQFYRRQGARLLGGIDYVQNVGPHQPPIKLRIMIHPIAEITPQEGYDLAMMVWSDAITQVGELSWE